jgi:hypothetical protein
MRNKSRVLLSLDTLLTACCETLNMAADLPLIRYISRFQSRGRFAF